MASSPASDPSSSATATEPTTATPTEPMSANEGQAVKPAEPTGSTELAAAPSPAATNEAPGVEPAGAEEQKSGVRSVPAAGGAAPSGASAEPKTGATGGEGTHLQPDRCAAWLHGAAAILTSLAWPIVALVGIGYVQGPIRDVLGKLPEMLDKTDRVAVGDFAIELRKHAPVTDIAILGSLTESALIALMRMAPGESRGLYGVYDDQPGGKKRIHINEEELPVIEELEKAQLVSLPETVSSFRAFVATLPRVSLEDRAIDDSALKEADRARLRGQMVKLTERGEKALAAIRAAAARVIRESVQAQASAKTKK